MKSLLTFLALLGLAAPVDAATTELSPHVYRVTEGVEFTIENLGADSYLFNWSDGSGSFTGIEDPSFVLTTGETYIFRRITAFHPFVITDHTLPTSGTDGSIQRTTSDGAVIDAATLQPIADFTADPAPTTDAISWTPAVSQLSNFFYTCRVTDHVGMTGGIRIEESPVPATVSSWSQIKSLYRD